MVKASVKLRQNMFFPFFPSSSIFTTEQPMQHFIWAIILPGELAFSCNPSYREASSWDGVGRMASLTLQKLQICVRTKAIFKLEIKGKELDSW